MCWGWRSSPGSDYPEGKFTLAFLGYGKNPEQAELELTFNWGVGKYELGTAYGHIAIGVGRHRRPPASRSAPPAARSPASPGR